MWCWEKYKTNLRFVSFDAWADVPIVYLLYISSYSCHDSSLYMQELAINSVLPSCSIQFELLLWRGLIFSIKLVVWSFLPAWSTSILGKSVQIDDHHHRWRLLRRDINDEFDIIKFNHITYYNVLYSRIIPAIPIIT